MSRFTSAFTLAGLFVAGALGAQEAAPPQREWQFSGGLAAGNTTVATDYGSGPPGASFGGRIQLGVGANPWTVLGIDLLWSNVGDGVGKLIPAPGLNAFMSAGLIAKLYPVKHGPFVEFGVGYAQGELQSGYSKVSLRGAGLRYGAGVDIAASNDEAWAVTLYVAGMLMPQLQTTERFNYNQCNAPAGSVCADVMPRSAIVSDVVSGLGTINNVNVLHVGIGITYAGYTAPHRKP